MSDAKQLMNRVEMDLWVKTDTSSKHTFIHRARVCVFWVVSNHTVKNWRTHMYIRSSFILKTSFWAIKTSAVQLCEWIKRKSFFYYISCLISFLFSLHPFCNFCFVRTVYFQRPPTFPFPWTFLLFKKTKQEGRWVLHNSVSKDVKERDYETSDTLCNLIHTMIWRTSCDLQLLGMWNPVQKHHNLGPEESRD